MSIQDKKSKIFGNIAAGRTLVDGKIGVLNKKKAKSLESFNNSKGKTISFLTDLIASLVGFMVLIDTIVDTITFYLTKIEREIKKGLKIELKSIVSCGVNPSIPSFLKSTGTGIIIPVNKIDFFDLFKTDPTTKAGRLMYQDVTNPLSNTSDFNTFLYTVIQDDGVTHTWVNNGKSILDIRFDSNGTGSNPNNSLTIKANSSYDTKKLTDLNNDFIDSLTLFNSVGIVNRILDSIYGSISVNINKSKKQLENEAKINTVINKFIDSDANDQITDDYFTFTNEETFEHEKEATLRQQGIKKIETSKTINTSIPIEMLTDLNTEMSQPNLNDTQRKNIISNNLTKMADQTTVNNLPTIPKIINNPNLPSMPNLPSISSPDDISIKMNFIQEIFNTLTKTIIGTIISPKVILIFLINLKIVYGQSVEYEDGVDFIKKNKNIFKSLIKGVSNIIIKILMGLALKEISKLMAQIIIKKRIEKAKTKKDQILSLTGPSLQTLNNLNTQL
jgi:hypothetical protein